MFLFFLLLGKKVDENCEKTPKTCAIIDSITQSSGCKRGQVSARKRTQNTYHERVEVVFAHIYHERVEVVFYLYCCPTFTHFYRVC